mgnify:CR=1 FL=1
MSATGNELRTRITSGPRTHASTLRNYRKRLSLDLSGAQMEVAARVEVDSRLLSRFSYDLSTPTPIREERSGAFTRGSLSAAASPSTLMVDVGSGFFMLRLDGDGDGGFESITPVSLEELEAHL